MAPQIPIHRFSTSPIITPNAPAPTTALSIGHEASAGYTPGNTPPIPNPPVWIPGDITQATLGAATLLMAFLVVVLKYREPLRTLAGERYVIVHSTLRELQIKAVELVIYIGERVGLWFHF